MYIYHFQDLQVRSPYLLSHISISLRLGNRSSPPLWPNEAVLSVQIDG